MTRPTAGDQRGMTLIETMLALGLSVMLVLPMMGWAQVAMHQQVQIRERNLAGASLGTLRTHFLRDVATAHRADVGGDGIADCAPGTRGGGTSRGKGATPLFALTRDEQRIVYSVGPTDETDAGLWRRVCDRTGDREVAASVLVDEVNAALTDASCDSRHPQQVRGLGRGEEPGVLATGDDRGAPAAAPGCRRVQLRVTTPELDQVVLSATVRSSGETIDEEQLLPDVVIGADPQSGAAPLQVRFTSKGSSDPLGGALTFEWDFGDGTTATEDAPMHVYDRPGTFTAVLTATNELGGSASASVPITVTNRPPVAVISAPPNDTAVARGQLVSFSSTGSNDDADAVRGGRIVSWTWDFGDGTTSTLPAPTKAYDRLRPEGYVVTLTVTDGDGATATALALIRVLNTVPTVQIVADRTAGSSPLAVQLAAIVSDEAAMAVNPPLTYAWDLGNGTTSNLATPPSVTYTGAGSRTVRLTVTDDAGATASATQVITVSAPAGVPAPSNLRMTNSGVEQGKRFAEFAWDRVEAARGYEVRLQCVGCSDTATGQETGTTVRIRNLTAARNTYTAQVRSRDAAGNWGPWSASITVRP